MDKPSKLQVASLVNSWLVKLADATRQPGSGVASVVRSRLGRPAGAVTSRNLQQHSSTGQARQSGQYEQRLGWSK